MQFATVITTLLMLGATIHNVVAAPAPAGTYVSVTSYSDDGCGSSIGSWSIQGSGAYRCVPVTNARSISKSGDCSVTTWSGSNCQGSSVNIDNGCHSILFASVSAEC